MDESVVEVRPSQNKTPRVFVPMRADGTYPEPIRPNTAESSVPKISQMSCVCADGHKVANGYLIATVNVDPIWFEDLPSYHPPGFEGITAKVHLCANDRGVQTKETFAKYLTTVALPDQMKRFNSGPLLFTF